MTARRFPLALAALAITVPAHAAPDFPHDVPRMIEEADAAGIAHVYDGPFEFFTGGGAASFDCNGDRMPDLVLAGGANEGALFVNRSEPGGRLSFERHPLPLAERERRGVTGAAALDIDADGHRDLVLLRVGANVVLRGLGGCRFEKATRQLRFPAGREWSTGFAATWEPGAKRPTMAIGNYIDRFAPGSPWGTCHDNQLVRPDGAVQTLKGHCTLSLMFTDWSNSGEPALRVSNDRQYHRGGQEQLWRVSPGRPAREYTARDGWRAVKIWGMGIASADLDADGRPEYALTSMGDTKLQRLDTEAEGEPIYEDIAFARGATAHRPYAGDDSKPSTGWHAEFADFNNDARLDLFIAKGNVEAMPDFAAFDPDNLLMGTLDGTFSEQGERSGLALDRKGRGAVVEDFNADGMLDLLVVNRGSNVSLFRSEGHDGRRMGNWLKLELANRAPNLDAVGARVSVKTGNLVQVREVLVGGGHASGRLGFVHVGLGVAERATVRVRWPDGDWSPEYRLFANQHARIERGRDVPLLWYPARTRKDEMQ